MKMIIKIKKKPERLYIRTDKKKDKLKKQEVKERKK
jgi:hypothetical protein